jgi:RecJ-like exonuclease
MMGTWYEEFDPKTMTFLFIDDEDEEVRVPARYEVCDTCSGKGMHVSPSIDCGGLTAEDFDDPEFAEAYMDSHYDVPCAECDGKRVIPVLNSDNIDEELLEQINDRIQCIYDDMRTEAAERMFGC